MTRSAFLGRQSPLPSALPAARVTYALLVRPTLAPHGVPMAFFPDVARIRYEGRESTNPLAFRHYNPDEVVEGKSMKDHLRFAVAYWHTFRGTGRRSVRPRLCRASMGRRHRLRRDGRQARPRRLRVHGEARRPLLLLPRPRRRPGRQEPARDQRQPRQGRQGPQGRAGSHRHQAALGHRQPVQQHALRPRSGHAVAMPTSSPTPRPRSRRPSKSPRSWAASTTSSGAAGKAT